MQVLIFQLFGPLASWGEIAVGERRASLPFPTKSAVLGIVAASLGIDRRDDGAHAALHERFSVAVRIDWPGTLISDYHTVQWASAADVKRARKAALIATRADLARALPLQTIVSRRDYLSDMLAVVALGDLGGSAPPLEQIAERMARPHFSPYLGRRSCTPSLPFAPCIVEGASPREALRTFQGDEEYRRVAKVVRRGRVPRTYLWEGGAEGASASVTRRDALLSRSRWQFTPRVIHRVDEESE